MGIEICGNAETKASVAGSSGATDPSSKLPLSVTVGETIPLLIVGKRRGRPQTITDMKAYRAAKAVEYRARKKAKA